MITDTVPILSIGWSEVTDLFTVFLSTSVVVGGVAAVLAVRFLPLFVRALRALVSR